LALAAAVTLLSASPVSSVSSLRCPPHGACPLGAAGVVAAGVVAVLELALAALPLAAFAMP
jgi:hypothetical protein